MPRLLTRISTSGNATIRAAQPSASPRSNMAACALARGTACLIFAIASTTGAASRPLTMTSAPMRASSVAVASPMPRLEPVTSASFPLRSMSIRSYALSVAAIAPLVPRNLGDPGTDIAWQRHAGLDVIGAAAIAEIADRPRCFEAIAGFLVVGIAFDPQFLTALGAGRRNKADTACRQNQCANQLSPDLHGGDPPVVD